MLIDMHCHTVRSMDSRLQPDEAIVVAKERGLDAICFTDHDVLWQKADLRGLAAEHDFLVLGGVEVSTEVGHVLAYGLDEFAPAMRKFEALVEACRQVSGALVFAHPYRRFFRFDLPAVVEPDHVSEAMAKRGLANVDAIEALNGATRDVENRLAAAVAARCGLPTTAGSDAHSTAELGRWFTRFEDHITTESDVVAAIRRGRVRGEWRPIAR
jgi:predicted metal-dependent phosphoesterase TrpH